MKIALLLALLCCAPIHMARAGQAQTIPLDDATRAVLPREQASGNAHGQPLSWEGVSMQALLRAAGAMPEKPLRGADLSRTVLVQARDGYRAVFSLAELDPTLGARQVLLADRCAGKPLDEESGPLRLLVPQDSRPARWVRQVQSITVQTP